MKPMQKIVGAMFLAAALVAPMSPAHAEPVITDTDPQFQIDPVGSPLTAVNTRAGATGALPDGTPVVYAPTYGEPALLNVIHGETGELLGSHELGDKTTSNYAGVSPDGSAYVAGQTPGANLFRYDPETGEVTDLGAPVENQTNISRLTAYADDGTLYSGTFPGGHVFSYHPDRGFTDFGPIAEGEEYARSSAFDGDKTLYVGTGTNARLFSIDVETQEKTEITLPEEFAGQQTYVNEMYYRDGLLFAFLSPGYVYLVYDTETGEWRETLRETQATPITDIVDGKVFFIKRDTNNIYSYELATGEVAPLTSTGGHSINNNRIFGLLELEDPAWPGLTLTGFGLTGQMWHLNLETGEFRQLETEAAGGPLKIASMDVAPDGKLYAGGFLTPGIMTAVDIDTLEAEELRGPGQTDFVGTATVAGEEQLYIGSYTDAGVWRHFSGFPWVYQTNPQRLTRLDGYGQERIMTIVGASQRIAVGSLADKGEMGGALTIYDPRNGNVAYTGEPVEDHAVASLLFQRVGPKPVMIGGTTSNQLGITHPDPEARLFIYDLQTMETEYAEILKPGVTSISTIRQLPDGRIWAVANDSTIHELTPTYDRETGTYAMETEEVVSIFGEPRNAGDWAGAKLDVLDDQYLVGNAAGDVYVLDMDTLEVTLVAKGTGATATGDGRFFFARNTQIFRGSPVGDDPVDPEDPEDPEYPAMTSAIAGTTVVGRTANAWGTVVTADATVSTQVQLPDGRWARSQTTTADADGKYVIELTYGKYNTGELNWRVVVDHADGTQEIGEVLTQTRIPRLTASSAGTKATGATTYAWGTITSTPDVPVRTQVQLADGRWVTSQRSTTQDSGWYQIELTYGKNTPGTYRWRVVADHPEVGTMISNEFTLVRN